MTDNGDLDRWNAGTRNHTLAARLLHSGQIDSYWRIVDVATLDPHTAGLEGNAFATRTEADAAIAGLDPAIAWTVAEVRR